VVNEYHRYHAGSSKELQKDSQKHANTEQTDTGNMGKTIRNKHLIVIGESRIGQSHKGESRKGESRKGE